MRPGFLAPASRIIAIITPGSGPSMSAATMATAPTRGRSTSTATTRPPTPAPTSARAYLFKTQPHRVGFSAPLGENCRKDMV